jgi:hypothetical protein
MGFRMDFGASESPEFTIQAGKGSGGTISVRR